MRVPTLFLTRRAAERAFQEHVLEAGLKGAKAFVKLVSKGFLRTDRGWEDRVVPGDGRQAYSI